MQITVHRDRLWRRVAFRGLVGAIDAYVDGDWDVDDLTNLARLFSRNIAESERLDSGLGRLIQPFERLRYWLSRATRAPDHVATSLRTTTCRMNSSKPCSDPTMSYSSGVFEARGIRLAGRVSPTRSAMSEVGIVATRSSSRDWKRVGRAGDSRRVAIRLSCHDDDHLSRAIRLRRAPQWPKRGCADRVTVLLSDYRELTGTFDKLVSVEMIEAVGAEYFRTFFETCAALVRPDGLVAIQAITVADQRFEAARRATDFIKRDIFPGGCIPSISALRAAASVRTDLRLVNLEDFSTHYARTMAEWRSNLEARRDRMDAITTERFRRRWMFYLSYCEGGFRERHTGLVQMVMARPEWRSEIKRQRSVGEATWTRA